MGTSETGSQTWSAFCARSVVAILLAAVIAAAGLWLSARDLLLVDTLDKQLGDLRIALFSPRSPDQRRDITIVLIGEETLRDYEVLSPVSGTLIGELVRAIDDMGPKAIGLDFIFDRRTQHTDRLLVAIKAAKSPLVLGAIDGRVGRLGSEAIQVQNEILAAATKPVGHLILERKAGLRAAGDATVRMVGATYPADLPRESFSAVLAKAAGYTHEPPSTIISWLLPPANASRPLFVTLDVPRHKPTDIKPGMAGLLPEHWKQSIAGRIVLIGANLGDRDQHSTPLNSLDEQTEPGVYIQAQAVAQRIDANRDLRVLPGWAAFGLVALTGVICFAAGHRWRLQSYEKLYHTVGLLVIGLVSCLAFYFWRVDAPSGPITLAWLAGAFAGHYSEQIYSRLGI